MIEFAGPRPCDDEVAAIVAALQTLAGPQGASPPPSTPAWSLAMRNDDLDYDALRQLVLRQSRHDAAST